LFGSGAELLQAGRSARARNGYGTIIQILTPPLREGIALATCG
jgi:hypothetical protein